MATKKQFIAELQRQLERSNYPWAKTHSRLQAYMVNAVQTVNGGQHCAIEGPAWLAAWQALGLPGKPTCQGLHDLEE